MKNNYISLALYFLPWLALGWLSGCGLQVVELDLEKAKPKLVVEGGISNLPPPHSIRLSWSTSFNAAEAVAAENALLVISDEQGRTDTLQEQEGGLYYSKLQGIPGRRYQLSIAIENQMFEASAFMPLPAQLDSFSIRYQEESTFTEEGYYVSLHQLDSLETAGYYRWLAWENGNLKENGPVTGYFATFSITTDNNPLSLQYPEPFKKGDHLLFQTIKMDKAVYTYYQGLLELMVNDGGLFGPIPVNPSSNISGGALGIFQANSITETRVVIE